MNVTRNKLFNSKQQTGQHKTQYKTTTPNNKK